MRYKNSSSILGLILLSAFGGRIVLSQDLVVVSSKVGECVLTVESNEKWHTLRLRAHHPNYTGCQIDKSSMLSVLNAAFLKNDEPKLEGSYSSLFIGRLIDYPWLSQFLATTAYRDPGWDSKRGRTPALHINRFVSQLLFSKELTAQIEAVFEKAGYRITGVTVEKVLVGRFREVPSYQGEMHPGRVPYDAQVWLGLARHGIR